MRKTSLLIPMVLALGACGGGGPGFEVQGSVNAAITDSSGTTNTSFNFAQATRVDVTLPDSGTTGVSGVCEINSTGRTVRLTGSGGNSLGLTQVTFTLPPWDQDNCTSCNHGNVSVVIGSTVFNGFEQRGSGTSQCTFTTTRSGNDGMVLNGECSGLASSGDARSVGLSTTLTLSGCSTN